MRSSSDVSSVVRPQRVIVVAVEGASFRMGDPLTPEVGAALDEAAATVLTELGGA